MSERKNKQIKIKIPKYDIEGQITFLKNVCDVNKFDVRTLITLIFADWICMFQVGCVNSSGDYQKSFHSFLATCENTANCLKSLKKSMENAENAKK